MLFSNYPFPQNQVNKVMVNQVIVKQNLRLFFFVFLNKNDAYGISVCIDK